ncbi:MAG: ABC transporter ATP-binding protein [Thermoplasmata archaeon]|nr:ABC transporter ATP-binding protein [Thermoplasmata archaeon]MCI4359125.1 ABC transporter ATP-binding protein [Thermoplasmata archaeon]
MSAALSSTDPGGAAIVARGISKRYQVGRHPIDALTEVDLAIPKGKIYGLIGRNGAGKTTFVRIAATQLLPTSGSLTVLGQDVVKDASRVRLSIASVPQESRPLYFLNVDELIFLYLMMRGSDRVDARQRTNAILDELSLTSVRKRLVSHLSGGMRRRAMVAMVLASDAEVVFLDEPTTGLDPFARREVWAAIRRAKRDRRTVLLTTHYLDEAEALSDRVALLEGGRLKIEGSPSEIRESVRLPYRVTVQGGFSRPELEPYGEVSPFDGGFIVFAREPAARELALAALGRGARVSLGPVSLEDIFLQIVGRPIDQDAPSEEEGGGGG